MSAPRDIINARQAEMLEALANSAEALQNAGLMAAIGSGDKQVYQRNMKDLRERGLVHAAFYQRKLYLHATDRGANALADYIAARRAGYAAALPSRVNWITAQPYVPTQARAYYRNNGNAHIASRGVRC